MIQRAPAPPETLIAAAGYACAAVALLARAARDTAAVRARSARVVTGPPDRIDDEVVHRRTDPDMGPEGRVAVVPSPSPPGSEG